MTNTSRRVFTGPFDTVHEAREATVGYLRPGEGNYPDANRAQFAEALSDCRVSMGDYDKKILDWFAGWEPEAVAVMAGLIRRAHAAGTRRSD